MGTEALATTCVKAASSARMNSYLVAWGIGDHEKEGVRVIFVLLLAGLSKIGPRYSVPTGKPDFTVKNMVADHGLRMISLVVALLALTLQ